MSSLYFSFSLIIASFVGTMFSAQQADRSNNAKSSAVFTIKNLDTAPCVCICTYARTIDARFKYPATKTFYTRYTIQPQQKKQLEQKRIDICYDGTIITRLMSIILVKNHRGSQETIAKFDQHHIENAAEYTITSRKTTPAKE